MKLLTCHSCLWAWHNGKFEPKAAPGDCPCEYGFGRGFNSRHLHQTERDPERGLFLFGGGLPKARVRAAAPAVVSKKPREAATQTPQGVSFCLVEACPRRACAPGKGFLSVWWRLAQGARARRCAGSGFLRPKINRETVGIYYPVTRKNHILIQNLALGGMLRW